MTIIGRKYDETQLPDVDGIGYTADELDQLGSQENRGNQDDGGAPPLLSTPPPVDIEPPSSASSDASKLIKPRNCHAQAKQ